MKSSSESRVTREERRGLLERERTLKDGQEERWQAYLLLRDVIRDAGTTDLKLKAKKLALRCLRLISTERFGRGGDTPRRSGPIAIAHQIRYIRTPYETQNSGPLHSRCTCRANADPTTTIVDGNPEPVDCRG